jgi:D-aminopeptidase
MRRKKTRALAVLALAGLSVGTFAQEGTGAKRPRARELGIAPGQYAPGPHNAITDVTGVRVGHATVTAGDHVRTGVTAILPHHGNLFREKVPAAVHIFNAFGKLVGATQVQELGQLETPILLTNTLSVWDAAAALADWMLAQPGNETVRSINPVVGETNDAWLNDIRGRHVRAEHVRAALTGALGADGAGPVAEGSVGAGAGTMAFGWKGGIGSSSRRVPVRGDVAFTVGVLVQTNFGGTLTIDGVPVWRELQPPRERAGALGSGGEPAGGSCMIVVATDAPLDARQLQRLAARAVHGMARAGSGGSHGSGDYVIAFSTANRYRARPGGDAAPPAVAGVQLLREDDLSPLFEAVIEATEEAIYNSLLRATTVRGREGHTAEAIPVEKLAELLKMRPGR